MSVKISVCLTDFREPVLTKICMKSIELTTYKNIEILFRDNSRENIGLAASSNLLAKQAKGEYLFFLNNDTIVKRDIFERLLESKFDVTGCRMFNYRGTQELVSGNSLDRFGCPAAQTGPVFYPDGAIFIKKSIFDEIGGFDERLFLYGEDRDLCWRAWLAGYNVGINNNAGFCHNSHSIISTNFSQRYHSEKNTIRIMLKNYTVKSLVRILPEYMFWSILELLYVTFTRPRAIFKSYIPAYWFNIKNLGDTLKLRKKIIRRIPDSKVPFSKDVGKLWVFKNMKILWR